MSTLSGPFQGDIKAAPGPKTGANEMPGPAGSPASFDTPYQHGNWTGITKAGNGSLGMTTQVDLPHGSAKMDSPFHGDMRPGVDSSKK